MSYLLVVAVLLIFLFLWSKLPDPKGPQPEAVNSLSDRKDNGTRSADTGQSRGVKLHPDQLGEAG
jgi:hypothetical protein